MHPSLRHRSSELAILVQLAILVLLVLTSCSSAPAATATPDSAAPSSAATVEFQGQRVHVARSEVDSIVDAVFADVVALSILFEDDAKDHVTRAATTKLTLQALVDLLRPEPVEPEDFERQRALQQQALHGELIFYNELDPERRSVELIQELRPWLDPTAVVTIKRGLIDDFEARASLAVVTIDPGIGSWNSAELMVR